MKVSTTITLLLLASSSAPGFQFSGPPYQKKVFIMPDDRPGSSAGSSYLDNLDNYNLRDDGAEAMSRGGESSPSGFDNDGAAVGAAGSTTPIYGAGRPAPPTTSPPAASPQSYYTAGSTAAGANSINNNAYNRNSREPTIIEPEWTGGTKNAQQQQSTPSSSSSSSANQAPPPGTTANADVIDAELWPLPDPSPQSASSSSPSGFAQQTHRAAASSQPYTYPQSPPRNAQARAATTTAAAARPEDAMRTAAAPPPPEVGAKELEEIELRLEEIEGKLSKDTDGQFMRNRIDDALRRLAEATERITLLERQEVRYSTLISDLEKQCKELREWDSVDLTWKIEDFSRMLDSPHEINLWSQDVDVAGYRMVLNLELSTVLEGQRGSVASADRDVGIYICHNGGLNVLPIAIGGSKVTLHSKLLTNCVTRQFEKDIFIDAANTGRGWKDFARVTAATMREKFLHEGDLEVKATIRVGRPKEYKLLSA